MKIVASFSTPTEAELVMCRLRSAGIACMLRDEFTVTNDWLASNAIGGVKIQVADEDFAAAREFLELPASSEGVVTCPYCGSTDNKFRVLSAFAAIAVILKLPLLIRSATVDCMQCKRSYKVPLVGR